MTLNLRMLGTGGAFANHFDNNNALFEENGFTLLVDCGITAPRALHEMGVDLGKIDAILISHLHTDHVGGLEELTFRMKFQLGKRPRLIVPEELEAPIWEHTLRGGLEYPEAGVTKLTDYYEVTVLKNRVPAELAPGFTIEALPTRHIPGKPSYSLVIQDKLFYSADMVFDRALLEEMVYGRSCRYLLHECQFTPPGIVHTTLEELLTLPQEMQKAIYLMHYEDDIESYIGHTGTMRFLRQRVPYEFD
ncbi:MBL fold metallo-hydrolase [Gorillibacterium timonense]|uniref:MBL fold metallo-hydrolase n=1 Tax=Gorillibacterium timonense TaxID=1689269 RepID=UPI00071DFF6B|nr:MBL fold metallo-hydrolase [Gorillibacterium timonense]